MGFVNTFMNWRTAAHTSEMARQGRRSVKGQRNAARRAAGMYVGPMAGIVNATRAVKHRTPIEAQRQIQAWFPPATQQTQSAPAGWYMPHGETQLRWWDGQQWTAATHPAPVGQVQG